MLEFKLILICRFGYTIKFSVFEDGILFVCFVNEKHEPLLNLLLLLASSHTFACMVTRLRIRKWLSKGSPTHRAFCWNPKKFERGKIFRLRKLRGNGWPHSYWSKQITCFDNVVDRWHYRQYFSFPTSENCQKPSGPRCRGGPHSGYTYYTFQKCSKVVFPECMHLESPRGSMLKLAVASAIAKPVR